MKQLVTFLVALSFGTLLHAQIKSDRSCRCPDEDDNKSHTQQVIIRNNDHQSQQHQRYQNRKQKRHFDLLHIQVGAAANHMYGTNITNLRQDFTTDMLDYQANGFIGIRMQPRKRRRSNVMGAWLTGGFHNAPALSSLLDVQGYDIPLDPETEFHEFREWEVGFMFKEWFRLSGGQGTQRFTNFSKEEQEFNYYIASTGFSLNILPSVKWNTTATFLFGQDFDQVAFRPSTGFSFRFNFL